MDPCGKAMSSITDDLKEPPILLQVPDGLFKYHQVKRMISHLKKGNCFDLEHSDEIATNEMTATVTTDVSIPSITKNVKSGCMKMCRHGVLHPVILLYWICTKT